MISLGWIATLISGKAFPKSSSYNMEIKRKEYTAEENFPRYGEQNSYVQRFLTPELYAKLSERTTSCGATIDRCTQNSVEFIDDDWCIGLVALDQQCYTVFREIFDPVIDVLHGFKIDDIQPPPELDSAKLIGGQLDEQYVLSCRVRTARSISNMTFAPAISRAERRDVERIMTGALAQLKGDLKGSYLPLWDMDETTKKDLEKAHLYFHKPRSAHMLNTRSVRDWPDARGIWLNKERSFVLWLNEEDHCRVISIQNGGDMKATFSRFCRGLTEVEAAMNSTGHRFAWSERYGFLNMCPSNIGTAVRCSVHIKLKHINKHPKFKEIVKKLGLEERGTQGEYSKDIVENTYDISNFARLNKTEKEFVQLVIDGVNVLIAMEKRLEKNQSIEDLLP